MRVLRRTWTLTLCILRRLFRRLSHYLSTSSRWRWRRAGEMKSMTCSRVTPNFSASASRSDFSCIARAGTIPRMKRVKLLQKKILEPKAQIDQRSISTSGTSEQSGEETLVSLGYFVEIDDNPRSESFTGNFVRYPPPSFGGPRPCFIFRRGDSELPVGPRKERCVWFFLSGYLYLIILIEKGRAELLSQPPVLSSIIDLLSDQSLNVMQKALHCLYTLAD
jgi:hypothetical protein